MSLREERWEALYDQLLSALAELGENNAIGDGDFWLIDDDWGGHHHKICVTKTDFWSSRVEYAIREVLANSFRDWGVFCCV